MLVNGVISSTAYSLIMKMDAKFAIQWKGAIQGQTNHEAIAMTNDENYLVLAPTAALSCTVVKLNTGDGSFAVQKSLASVTSCTSVTLSNDNTYVYVSGTMLLAPNVFMLNLSDYSIVKTVSIGISSVASMYAFTLGANSYMLLLNGKNTLGTNYQILSADMSLSSGFKQWGKTVN